MSPSLKKVLEIAQEIGRGEVVDKTLNIVHQHGLVATEFLLAAGLLEGSGVFAEVFSFLFSFLLKTIFFFFFFDFFL